VTEKTAQPGEMVSPISAGGGFTRTGIGTIVDMDSLEVEVDVRREFHQSSSAAAARNHQTQCLSGLGYSRIGHRTIPTADRAKATVKVADRHQAERSAHHSGDGCPGRVFERQ